MFDQRAFIDDARCGAQVKGRARRQADEIDFVGLKAVLAAEMQWNESHPRRERQIFASEHIQTIQILGSNCLVGANIEDVDPWNRVP